MDRFLPALTAFFASALALAAVTVESAHTRYYTGAEIRPISGYFGKESHEQRFRTVVPSEADAFRGQYFIARLDDPSPGDLAEARMTYLPSDSKEMRTHTWNLQGLPLKGWLYLGLTGSDWPSPEVQPLAWRIELLDAAGKTLADWKSFLWEMP